MLVAMFAIVAVLAAAFMMGAFDAPGGNGDTNGSDDMGGDRDAVELPFDISNGDLIEYTISHSKGALEGVMRTTFLNVMDDSYDVRMEQTINGQTSNLTWTAYANAAVGGMSDDDGPEGFGELIGAETIGREFGPRNALHYRASEDGTVIDHYVGEESRCRIARWPLTKEAPSPTSWSTSTSRRSGTPTLERGGAPQGRPVSR